MKQRGLVFCGILLQIVCLKVAQGVFNACESSKCVCDPLSGTIECQYVDDWPVLATSQEQAIYRKLTIAPGSLTVVNAAALATFPNLTMLDVKNNLITQLGANAFGNLSALIDLRLGFNPVERIHKDAFVGIPNLLFLIMWDTHVTRLEYGLFHPIPKLSVLELWRMDIVSVNNKNKITHLPFGIFDPLHALTTLLLQNLNSLTEPVHPAFFSKLVSLRFLMVDHSTSLTPAIATIGALEPFSVSLQLLYTSLLDPSEPYQFPEMNSLLELQYISRGIARIPRSFFRSMPHTSTTETLDHIVLYNQTSLCEVRIIDGHQQIACHCEGGTKGDGTFCDYDHFCLDIEPFRTKMRTKYNVDVDCSNFMTDSNAFPGDTCTLSCVDPTHILIGDSVATCTTEGFEAFTKCMPVEHNICNKAYTGCECDVGWGFSARCKKLFWKPGDGLFPYIPLKYHSETRIGFSWPFPIPADALFGMSHVVFIDFDEVANVVFEDRTFAPLKGGLLQFNLRNNDVTSEMPLEGFGPEVVRDMPRLALLRTSWLTHFDLDEATLEALPFLNDLRIDFATAFATHLEKNATLLSKAKSLEAVSMTGNSLTIIRKEFFADLPRLRSVFLYDSPVMSVIEEGAFHSIPRVNVTIGLTAGCTATDTRKLKCTCTANTRGNGTFCLPACEALNTTEPHLQLVGSCRGLGGDHCFATCRFRPYSNTIGSVQCTHERTWKLDTLSTCPVDSFKECGTVAFRRHPSLSCVNRFSPLSVTSDTTWHEEPSLIRLAEFGPDGPRCTIACDAEHIITAICLKEWLYFNHAGEPMSHVDAEDYCTTFASASKPGIVAAAILVPAFILILFVTILFVRMRQNKVESIFALSEVESKIKRLKEDLHRANVMSEALGMENVAESTISRSKLIYHRKLGEGNFGTVHAGTYKGTPVAVKMLKLEQVDVEQQAKFAIEAKVMACLRHPNLVMMIGHCIASEPFIIVMELMTGGDLHSYLVTLRNGSSPWLSQQMPILVAVQIASAMAYLSEKTIVHRDLAARNVLVGADLSHVKISDYGMARYIGDNDYYRKQTKGAVPLRWMSPESAEDQIWTTQSDVWSFAVCIWEVTSLGRVPFGELDTHGALIAITSCQALAQTPLCHPALYKQLQRCWQYEPSDRPTFHELYHALSSLNASSTSTAQPKAMSVNPLRLSSMDNGETRL
eukprot:m.340811 g.340811  ORF g.340811 m.340811 type:complete len:1193 (+) comp16107_c0_seq4:186-3764(+)